MSNAIQHKGQRFSHLYLGGGEPVADSKRMRARLAMVAPVVTSLHNHLHAELGVYVSHKLAGRYGASGVAADFFHKAALRDVLDSVTLIYKFVKTSYPSTAEAWLTDVRRVFSEERLSYTVDDEAGVHYSVDPVF